MNIHRCPAGQRLFQRWAQRVRSAKQHNWQRHFHHKTMYGYKTHVKNCQVCLTAYQARHGTP